MSMNKYPGQALRESRIFWHVDFAKIWVCREFRAGQDVSGSMRARSDAVPARDQSHRECSAAGGRCPGTPQPADPWAPSTPPAAPRMR
jgi:hypothetical protein